eukprot:6713134-Ditylum_brightwellii.AAC.1
MEETACLLASISGSGLAEEPDHHSSSLSVGSVQYYQGKKPTRKPKNVVAEEIKFLKQNMNFLSHILLKCFLLTYIKN